MNGRWIATLGVEVAIMDDRLLEDEESFTVKIEKGPGLVTWVQPDTDSTKLTTTVVIEDDEEPLSCPQLDNELWLGKITGGKSTAGGINSYGWSDTTTFTGEDYPAAADRRFEFENEMWEIRAIAHGDDDLLILFRSGPGSSLGDLETILGNQAQREKLFLYVTDEEGTTKEFGLGDGSRTFSRNGVEMTLPADFSSWSQGDRVCMQLTEGASAIPTDAPTVSGVAFTSDPNDDDGDDDTYAIGDAIEATVTFSATVTVTGHAAARADGRQPDGAGGLRERKR